MKTPRLYLTVCALAVLRITCAAQDPEDFRVEVTTGLWLRDTSGTIRSGVAPVDLRTDLAIEQRRPQFAGRLVLQPARRHRIVVEGVPYRLSGRNEVVRQFTFAGRTYTVEDVVDSEADITFVFGGYQYDLVSRPGGHVGVLGGVGYVDATGTLRSQAAGFRGTESQTFPFPAAGAEFRWFPLPGRALVSVSGGVKGMSLGDYGHFVETAIHGGVGLGRVVTLLAGYRLADADVHRRDGTRGFAPRFSGPVFSVQFRR